MRRLARALVVLATGLAMIAGLWLIVGFGIVAMQWTALLIRRLEPDRCFEGDRACAFAPGIVGSQHCRGGEWQACEAPKPCGEKGRW